MVQHDHFQPWFHRGMYVRSHLCSALEVPKSHFNVSITHHFHSQLNLIQPSSLRLSFAPSSSPSHSTVAEASYDREEEAGNRIFIMCAYYRLSRKTRSQERRKAKDKGSGCNATDAMRYLIFSK